MSGKKKHKKSNKRFYREKIRILGILFVIVLFFLSYRVLSYKVNHGEDYERYVVAQQVNRGFIDRTIEPNRGSIVDKYKRTLASSETVYDVFIDIKQLLELKKEKRDKVFTSVEKILNISIEDLEGFLKNKDNKKNQYFKIAFGIDMETAHLLRNENLVHVHLEEGSKRTYPNGNVANGLIGFTRGNFSYGIEKYYNHYLTGEEGRAYRHASSYIDAETKLLPAIPGKTLITTIDLDLQNIAEDVLKDVAEEYEPLDASVIITNPYTGEIYAYAQYPNFDLNNEMDNRFVNDKNFPKNWDSLMPEEQNEYFYQLWKDKNLGVSFEPGSTYKPIVVSAALEENLISETSMFNCTGVKWIGNDAIPCANGAVHGYQTLEQVLANSCNSGMIEIIQALGSDKYRKYQKDFGFGEFTEIDLPETETFNALLHSESQLKNPLNLATNSMGQGFNVNQVQMIMAFAATINGGNLMKPYVVSQIIDKNNSVVEENKPTIVRKVVSQEVSDSVRGMLRSVITPTGTGRRAIIEGYDIGGKTGTAQQGVRDEKKHVYSFIGYVTAESPEFLVSLSMNQPQKQTEEAPTPAYAFKEIMTRLIRHKNIRPIGENQDNDLSFGEDAFEMPDLAGKTIIEASEILSVMDVDYDFIGTEGNVVRSHIPNAGNKITSNTKAYIYMENDNSGSEFVELMDIIGLNQSYAKEVLEEQGFIPVFVEANYSETIGIMESEENPVTNVDDETDTSLANEDEPYESEYLEEMVFVQMPSSGKLLPKGTVIKVKTK